jgi:hypothetical protein
MPDTSIEMAPDQHGYAGSRERRITSAELIANSVRTESIGARHDEHRAQRGDP